MQGAIYKTSVKQKIRKKKNKSRREKDKLKYTNIINSSRVVE